MHVALITRGYPTARYPGNGIFELDQARALRDYGHKVTIIAFDFRSLRRLRRFGFSHKYIDGINIYVENIPLSQVPSRFAKSIETNIVDVVTKELKMNNDLPDLVHAHFARSGIIGQTIRDLLQIPLVYTEHSSAAMNRLDSYLNKAVKVWGNCESLIAVSTTLADIMREYTMEPITVIGNVLSNDILRCKPAHRTGKLRFVSVGSLNKVKSHDTLIEAFSRLPRYAHLEIFGDGPEKESLKSKINSLDLEGRVILRGHCTRSEIASCFSEADCFVLASRSETFGVAYIEALALGLPVVATECGGPFDYMSDEFGKMVPVDDVESLANAMQVVGSSTSYDSYWIKEKIEKVYSPNCIASQLDCVYRAVL